MGFLGEIRKLLFGVKSVSKSGAEKVAHKAEEIGEDILDKGKDAYDKGKDIAGDVVEKASDALSNIKDKAKAMLDDVGENDTVGKAADFTEGVGKKVMDKGGEVAEKAGDIASKVGSKVLEVGGEAVEKAGEISEAVGEKVLAAKEVIMDKAQIVADKVSEKYDETYEKAKALEAEEALEGDGEFADTPIDMGGSLLEDTDDFFSKAEKYAEGNYSGKDKPAPAKEGDIQIGDTTISLPEGDTIKEKAKAAGFEDADGDGNEIVDDAIIIVDEEPMALEAPDAIAEVAAPVIDKAANKAEDLVAKVEETVTDKATEAKDMAGKAVDVVKDQTETMKSEMNDMMDKVLGEEE